MLKDVNLGLSFLQRKWASAPGSGWNAEIGFQTHAKQTSTVTHISSVVLSPVGMYA